MIADAAAAAGSPCESLIDSGDTAMMMVATAFVMLQTPAMGLAQAGLIRRKNALSMLLQTMVGMAIGSMLWFVAGFALTFGRSYRGWIGRLDHAFLRGVPRACPYPHMAGVAGSIPGVLFAAFQMMFALMTPVIVTGTWAERMEFDAFVMFIAIWPFLVYYPLAHWMWNVDGWLFKLGVLDFAGGLVIHLSTGVAAIAVSVVLSSRVKLHEHGLGYHNLPLSAVGCSLIWCGWYFFNGGSAYHANATASSALLCTHLAASTSSLLWLCLCRWRDGFWRITEVFNGAYAGLAAITSGSGYIAPQFAPLIAAIATLMSYAWVSLVKPRLRLDDALDVAGLQGSGRCPPTGTTLARRAERDCTGVPGLVGTLLIGWFALENSGAHLMRLQLLAAVVTIGWAGLWSYALMLAIQHTIGTAVHPDTEEIGLDLVQVGEQAYDEALSPVLDLGDEIMTSKLCDACRLGDAHRVASLIRHSGANPDKGDYDGRTPIMLAAAEGHLSIVQMLHGRYGVSINARDRYGNTPLAEAVSHRRADVVEYLEQHGAEIDFAAGYNEDCDLIGACSRASIDEIRLRLRDNVAVDHSDYDGRTGLHVAAAEGRHDVVRLLLQYHANPLLRDRWNRTAADDALLFKRFRCAAVLQRHMHPTDSCASGCSSRRSGSPDSLLDAPLLGRSVEPAPVQHAAVGKVVDCSAGRTLVSAAARGDVDEVRQLVRKGARADFADYDRRTALHVAAANGHDGVVRHLVDVCRVDVDCCDRFGKSPLQDALAAGYARVVQVLRGAGASCTIGPDATRKLCTAAAAGDLAAMQLLRDDGVDLARADYDGRTGLHVAAAEGQVEVVAYLIAQGVDLSPRDRWGGTPLDDAVRERRAGARQLLERALATTRRLDRSPTGTTTRSD